MPGFALTVTALAIEAAAGYPAWLLRRIGHPVMWIGRLIAVLDRTLNRARDADGTRRILGGVALLAILAATLVPTILLQSLAGFGPLAVLASTLLAQRGLHQHVRAVERGLRSDGLAGGRAAVAHIVGRNPATLDAPGVARAAIESLAENFSDGVVAPAVWCVIAGLPGIAAYKAANTADSMIGHRTPRHAAFGWASARFDDLINLPASRLAALWLIVAALAQPGADPIGACRAVWRDAGKHRSPNAGWPEAAMAGALGLRLAGPRVYGATRVVDAWMGDGRAECGPDDIANALALYRTACVIQAVILLLVALALPG
jgi:adenosylcobinamide-phosphate synthase